jgi:predicted ribosome-associated RNA-binding protein Tma20
MAATITKGRSVSSLSEEKGRVIRVCHHTSDPKWFRNDESVI